jgi:replicative DNA helicase/5S rRNA maturation endonuclease (ribonuclease M5)
LEVSHQPCPYCNSSDAYSYNVEKNVYRCFSCGAAGRLEREDTWENEEDLIDMETYVPEEYRGIKKDTLEKYGVYFSRDQDGNETVHYTYPNGTKHRLLPKTIRISGQMDKFYGQDDYPDGGKTITVTEGEEDRLSVIQMMGDWPTVSVPGATPSKAFWQNAKDYLSGFQEIKLSVDPDEPGNALAEKFYRMFPGKVYRVDHNAAKDANEYLTTGKTGEYKKSWWNAQKLKPANILSSFEDFKKLYEETPDYEYFPTGIEELDRKMLGIHKGAFTVVLAETGLGKCLAPQIPVLRYDGKVVRADEVNVGDQLMGPDSKPRNVTAVNFGNGQMYRITPVKGEAFECNDDHILPLVHTSTGEKINITVKDYLQLTKTQKHKLKLWRTGVDFEPMGPNQPTLAYAVGAYLGDGRAQGPELCMGKAKEPVFQHMIDTGNLKPTRIKFERGAYYIGFSKSSLLWDYISNATGQSEDCLSVRKMPEAMKRGHLDTRKAILSGLLDTDGSATVGGAEITQKSKRLADDICFVARSLGLAAYKKTKWVNGQEYFRVGISGDMTGLFCKRLKFTPRRQIKDVLRTGFSVESIGEGTYRGIVIDGDHLFLLGDFTVTHNTEFFRYLEYQCLTNTDYSIAFCHAEETKLRSILGLVSYDLGVNVTRKDLIDFGGYEELVYESMENLSRGERMNQFSIRVDEGVDEIIEQVRFLATALGVDFIFIEPIQDFVSAANTTEKENLLTDLSNKLKRLAPELNVGIVVIAHANKDGEAKYCASIVQSAAYEIRMERDVNSDDPVEANTTKIFVGRKNRTGGGSGPAGELTFDRDSYTLTPVSGPDEPIFDNTDSSKVIGF